MKLNTECRKVQVSLSRIYECPQIVVILQKYLRPSVLHRRISSTILWNSYKEGRYDTTAHPLRPNLIEHSWNSSWRNSTEKFTISGRVGARNVSRSAIGITRRIRKNWRSLETFRIRGRYLRFMEIPIIVGVSTPYIG